MQRFACERCGNQLPFDASTCPVCGALIGYVPEQRDLRVLEPADDPATYAVGGSADVLWRCLNAAWGCNWTLAADAGGEWCRSCSLTRGRPDLADPAAVERWAAAEAAKRRLVHQLDSLALPIEPRSRSAPHGLAFDLVDLPGVPGITGHLDGIVTLDLAEADDQHRDQQRRQLGEPFRTLIGHLRHEVGHYYWDRLVGQSDHLAAFRRLFGDERADYRRALSEHHTTTTTWDRSRYVSAYATAHPLEDWAETFAHYLHVVDALDTAIAYGLVDPVDEEVAATQGFAAILERWAPVAAALDAIADSLGTPRPFPFEPTGVALDKLAFVHARVVAHTARDDFYATQ